MGFASMAAGSPRPKSTAMITRPMPQSSAPAPIRSRSPPRSATLETERGYHLMIADPEVMPRIPTADADGKFVATPMATGLRFAGTVELAGLAAPPDWRRAHILLAQGRKMLPGLAASHPEERISVWMGHRPSLPDSLPVLGPSRTTPDVVYAFGHGHAGMTAAPMTGKVVADLVAGRLPSIDIASFAAGRFS